ncbi:MULTISPECIES: adenosylcobinamide-GDP ribazoletransferase [Sphingomonadales]|jgi:adenosylcobinamide-GDP ribazoletransferase|uniref:Adenosylcobinamide-GDP ribazoletransferase n=1 Tax=Blastomonas natatoria TaxID=34015 RepID=A0A2V3URI6_9SPHN|nr:MULTISPECIES: adenosylcobinamide-GDP ribazoletransferase [Sphingomonadales]MBA4040485.1 adenosylcobinamide-GDP ribazoletransferase [Sphingobium sp.]MDK2758726.1 adenosylcobinamide-GDP ribazoletransferase [Blastomonas fulva]PXW69786.1 cobalamin-5'-phosphate synthase [Blastomonas natatoria]
MNPAPSPVPPWAPPLLALQFLTRVPVPVLDRLEGPQVQAGLVRAVGWFPLVGTLIGMVTAGAVLGLAQFLPLAVAVIIALMIEARLTGAFHEDAVADFCDAFGGGYTTEDVRRIMKDSRIGSYGALGLGLAVALRAVLLMSLPVADDPLLTAAAIVASACFARALVVAAMALIAPAPAGTGLAKDIGNAVTARTVVMGAMTAFPALAAFAFLDGRALLATVLAGGIFLIWLRGMLLRRIGGTTGDCLGFGAYTGQLILLLAAVALGHGG